MRIRLQSIIGQSKGFLVPFVLFIIALSAFLLTLEKGSEVLLINQYSSPLFDKAFLWITDLGLGSVLAGTGIVLAIWSFRWSILALGSLSLVGIFTFLFKRMVFVSETRPMHYFYYADFPRFIHDAPLIYFHSFPSGHTMAAFGFFSMLSYLSGKRILGGVFFLVAFLIGFSRIYLLQHFGVDVLAGSILGVIASMLSIILFDVLIQLGNRSGFRKGLWHLLPGRSD
jgi:membrane-associated phospholipid phosphatase